MPVSRLVIPGEPKGKGRPRFVRATGRAYSPANTVAAEDEVRSLWQTHARRNVPAGTPFALRIVARYSRPDTHYARNGDVKPNRVNDVPGTKGARKREAAKDIDNVAKLVLDALNGVAWSDDDYCTGILALKEWSETKDGELDIEVVWADE